MAARHAVGHRSADADGQVRETRYAWSALSVVALACVLVGLNLSAVNVALPELVRHFEASSTQANWIVTIYALVGTLAALACGRLADAMSRRLMYLLGLGIFTVASLLLGFSPNIEFMLALRAVQAIASTMLLMNSTAIISAAFPASMLTRALSLYMLSFSVALLLGPMVGGALTTSLSWRWVFWFNVPVGLVCLGWGIVTLRRGPRRRKLAGFDYLGNVLLILGLGGFVVALSDFPSARWTGPTVIAGGTLAALFIPLFLWWQTKARTPLLDITKFRNRPFTLAVASGLATLIGNTSVAVVIGLYLQSVLGMTPLAAGVALLPLAGANILASATPFITRALTPSTLATVGAAFVSSGLLVLCLATGSLSDYGTLCIGLVLVGFGYGVFLPANIAVLLGGVPEEELGVTNAIRITVQNIGIVVGTALALSLLAVPLTVALRRAVFSGAAVDLAAADLDRVAHGYQLVFGVVAGLSLLSVATSVASGVMHKHPAQVQQ